MFFLHSSHNGNSNNNADNADNINDNDYNNQYVFIYLNIVQGR